MGLRWFDCTHSKSTNSVVMSRQIFLAADTRTRNIKRSATDRRHFCTSWHQLLAKRQTRDGMSGWWRPDVSSLHDNGCIRCGHRRSSKLELSYYYYVIRYINIIIILFPPLWDVAGTSRSGWSIKYNGGWQWSDQPTFAGRKSLFNHKTCCVHCIHGGIPEVAGTILHTAEKRRPLWKQNVPGGI